MDQMRTTGTWKNQRDGFSRQQEKDLWLLFVENILAYFNKDKEVKRINSTVIKKHCSEICPTLY